MRSLPSGVLALLESGRFSIRHLIRFDLDVADGGPTGLWNDTYPLTYGGIVYAPTAGNMQLGAVPSSTELSADALVVTMTGFDPSVAAVLDGVTWHQRPVTVFKAWLNPGGDVLHVEPEFSGFLDAAPVEDQADGTSTLSLTIESNNRELGRSSGRRRSDNDQRTHGNATDGFFKYSTAAATNLEITWGRSGPRFPVRRRHS